MATQPTGRQPRRVPASARRRRARAPVAYVIKIRLETMPPATRRVGRCTSDDFRIPKYWEYQEGIYFKMSIPSSSRTTRRTTALLSRAGTEFIETGLTLSRPDVVPESVTADTELPTQREALER